MQNLYSLHSLAFFHAGQLAVIEETSNPVALRRLGTRKVHVVAQRGVRTTDESVYNFTAKRIPSNRLECDRRTL